MGNQGSAPGQLSSPTGLALDGAGDIFVTDSNNNRVEEFTTAGAFVAQWGVTAADRANWPILWASRWTEPGMSMSAIPTITGSKNSLPAEPIWPNGRRRKRQRAVLQPLWNRSERKRVYVCDEMNCRWKTSPPAELMFPNSAARDRATASLATPTGSAWIPRVMFMSPTPTIIT